MIRYARFRAALALVLAVAPFSCLAARNWEDIRRSGTIQFAVSEQPTVDERAGRDAAGFHTLLATAIARTLGLRAKFVVVGPLDYAKTDIYGVPLILRGADVLADHFPRTMPFRNAAAFLPLYPSLKACVYNPKKTTIRTPGDLARWKASALDSDAAFYRMLEKKIGRPVERRSQPTSDETVRAVVTGAADYTVLDSDLAFYFIRKNPSLAVQVDVLQDVSAVQDIGWYLERDNAAFRDRLSAALNTVRTNGEFARLWAASFGQTYVQYREAVKILEQKGDELFRKSLDLAFNRRFEDSIALFLTARRMNLVSERLQRLYDTIYLDWMTAEAKRGREAQMAVLDRYFAGEPSAGFAEQLKSRDRALYQDYLKRLKRDRDRMIRESAVTNAVAVQSVISILNPDQASEKQAYDDLFLALLEDQEKKSGTAGLDLLDRYVQGKPTAYFFRQLKTRLPSLYNDYLYNLKGERDSAVRLSDLDRARKVQETIVSLSPDAPDEANTLAILDRDIRSGQVRTDAADTDAEAEAFLPVLLNNARPGTVASAPEELRRTADEGETAIENYEGRRYFGLGEKARAQGSVREALEAYQNARNLNYRVQDCDVRIREARTALKAEEDRENERKMKEFGDAFSRGLSAYLREDYPQAQEEFLVCLALFPDNAQARKFSEIVADNLRVEGERSIEPSSPYYSYYLNRSRTAEDLMRKSDYAGARRIYEEILTVFPNLELARQKLIVCLYRADPGKLRDTLRDYFAEAKKLADAGRTREAYLKFSFIHQLDQGYPGITNELARTRPEKPPVPKAAASGGLDYDGLMREAVALYEDGRLEESLRAYRKILNYFPEDYKALVNASRIENRLRVIRESDRDAGPPPGREKAENYYLKGQFYFRLQDYRKALDLWEEAYRADPTFRKAYIDIRRVKKILNTLP